MTMGIPNIHLQHVSIWVKHSTSNEKKTTSKQTTYEQFIIVNIVQDTKGCLMRKSSELLSFGVKSEFGWNLLYF